MTKPIIACSILTILVSFGCQKVENPTPVLTRQQWKKVEANILKTAPTPDIKVGAKYGDEIELIGFDVKQPIEAGKEVKFTWYWKALKDVDKNWKIFVHFDSSADAKFRQNLDHAPMNGLFVTSNWKKGMIIKDEQTVTINPNYPAGKAIAYVGLWRGSERLPVSNDVKKDKVNRVMPPALTISNSNSTLPKYAARHMSAAKTPLVVDGKLTENVWRNLPSMQLTPLGNHAAKETWVKLYYTDEHLILGAYLKDEHIWGNLKDRDSRTWEEEVLEMFLDVDGDGLDYLELQITPNNVIFDANFAKQLGRGTGTIKEQIAKAKAFNIPGLESAVHIDGSINDLKTQDRSWSVEIRIPLKSIPGTDGKKPKAGVDWFVNFYRFDRPLPKQRLAYAWSTAANSSFHDVSKYGQIKFLGNLPQNLLPKLKMPGNNKKKLPLLRRQPNLNTQLKLAPGTKIKFKKPNPKINKVAPKK